MKATKKVLALAIVAMMVSPLLQSCGKSSKGKIAGEWTIASMTSTSTTTGDYTRVDADGDKTEWSDVEVESTTTIEGTSISTTTTMMYEASDCDGDPTNVTDTETESGTGEFKITFEKDGTFELTQSFSVDVTAQTNMPEHDGGGYCDWTRTDYLCPDETTCTFTKTVSLTESGTWSFLGKNKSADLKNKERIILSTTNQTITVTFEMTQTTTDNSATMTVDQSTTSTASDEYQVWTLETSKKKEMVSNGTMDRNEDSTTDMTYDDDDSTWDTQETCVMTTTSSFSVTLSQE